MYHTRILFMRMFSACMAVSLAVACSRTTTIPEAPGGGPDATLRMADIGRACTEESPAFTLDAALRDAIPVAHRERHRTSDSIWVAFAKELPGGIGGIFRKGDHDFLWLVEPARRDEAVNALAATPTGQGLIQSGFRLYDVTVLKARWDFAQLAEWFAYVYPSAFKDVKWSSAAIDEGDNRLDFAVINEGERQKLEANLQRLDLPCNLIAVRIRAYAVPL